LIIVLTMQNLIRIRKAKLKDAKEIAQISLDFLKQHSRYSPLDPINFPTIKKEILSWQKLIKNKKYTVFVAEVNGDVAGLVSLFFPKRLPFKRIQNVGEIEVLAVHKNERKNNIGTLLLKKAISFFRSKKVRYIQCNVRLKNPALEFWKKRGFKEFDVRLFRRI